MSPIHARLTVYGSPPKMPWFEAAKQKKTTPTRPPTAPTQLSVEATLEKVKPFSRDSQKARGLNNYVMEMIALDDQPFSVVGDRGFRRLVGKLEPRYVLPSRRYFSDVALPELNCRVSAHLKVVLAANSHISFTTDIWSSDVSPMSMLSLTAQWIEDDFTLQKVVLHTQECRGSHTGANIAAAFNTMFATWGIPKEHVHVILRDNARNMARAALDGNIASLPCMAHTLQLAVNEGVLAQPGVTSMLKLGRQIIGHFKHSTLAYTQLEDVQIELGMKIKRFQQDVQTRWNSTYYMMQSLLEQRRALAMYATDYDLPATLTLSQWGVMENMLSILAPFEEMTRDISSAAACVSTVIPSVLALTRLLATDADKDEGIKTAKRTLLAAVKRRFASIQTEPLYCVATLLDPRYKDRFFDKENTQSALDMLKTAVEKLESSSAGESAEDAQRAVRTEPEPGQSSQDMEPGETDDAPPQQKAARRSTLSDMFDEILQESGAMDSEPQVTLHSALQVSVLLNKQHVQPAYI